MADEQQVRLTNFQRLPPDENVKWGDDGMAPSSTLVVG